MLCEGVSSILFNQYGMQAHHMPSNMLGTGHTDMKHIRRPEGT